MALGWGAQAQSGRIDFPAADAPFTNAAVVHGTLATRAQCAGTANAVWAQPEGESGECIRYWHAGLNNMTNNRALFFFSGDMLVGNTVFSGYEGQTPARIQATIDAVPARLGVPYVFVARPGTYGSSGEHKQRRRRAEALLMSAALDEIKKRHGLGELVLAGLSGGGHVVASLLGYRSDIVCAVPTSSVSSPKMRMQLRGWTIDATGYSDSYEPMDNLRKEAMHPALRVFVLGDPADRNVPWTVQTALADRLRMIGVQAHVLTAEATDPDRHFILQSALLVGSMCLLDRSTEQIQQRAAQGLKG
ncbi:hypothetical protein [Polaromonas sp.]|uniref:alpha/beta hydrolase family protein n=1 Tax=Polaromonas sp. TaxID=1869339 RepID=UPI0025D40105|nr:hypothetical protein [Polaromonas sp.]